MKKLFVLSVTALALSVTALAQQNNPAPVKHVLDQPVFTAEIVGEPALVLPVRVEAGKVPTSKRVEPAIVATLVSRAPEASGRVQLAFTKKPN